MRVEGRREGRGGWSGREGEREGRRKRGNRNVVKRC
jgi:hypothetical protein